MTRLRHARQCCSCRDDAPGQCNANLAIVGAEGEDRRVGGAIDVQLRPAAREEIECEEGRPAGAVHVLQRLVAHDEL